TRLQGSETGDPRLVIAEEELDLGWVYETNAYEHSFHITNATDQPVTITRFETTCDCLGITPEGGQRHRIAQALVMLAPAPSGAPTPSSPPIIAALAAASLDASVTLQPQETKTFSIRLKLVSRATSTNYQQDEPFQVRFGAVCVGEDQKPFSPHWQLSCVIVPTIRLRPSVIQLGTESCRRPKVERSVDVEATNAIAWIEYEAPPTWDVEIVPNQEDSSPKKFKVIVQTHGQLTPRQVSEVIRLFPVDPDEKRLPGKELNIQGEIVPDVASFPPEIHH